MKLEVVPFDRQATASSAGALLEQTLDHLTLLYRCGLPRSPDGDYVLSELLNGVATIAHQLKIRRPKRNGDGTPVTPSEQEEIAVKPCLDAIGSMVFIRNQVGAHFNAGVADISDAVVEQLAERTVELARLLVCPSCGEVARRKAGTHFTCACKQLQMDPLESV